MTQATKAAIPKIPGRYSVHSHPREGLDTMNPPIGCESIGPMNTVNENSIIIVFRSCGVYISANTAPASVRGPAPNSPEKKRQIKIDARSCDDLAVAKQNTENPNMEIVNGK